MDLYEAFDLRPGAMVAVVGGGGKTSLVYRLAAEAAERDLPALVTTTVKFTRVRGEAMPPVVEAPGERIVAELRGKVTPGTVVVAAAGTGQRGRLLGFAPEVVDTLRGVVGEGLIAVEADGSAHRPFKAPAAHEPVIPSGASDVVVCVGLEVLGRPLAEPWVHRPEIASALAKVPLGTPLDTGLVAAVLAHEDGGRKGVPGEARMMALLNQPADEEYEKLGFAIAQRVVYAGYARAVVGTAHRGVVHGVVR